MRSILLALAGVALLASPGAMAAGDAPCTTHQREATKIAGYLPDVCMTSVRLVPNRPVVLALWSTDPETPDSVPLAAVFDLAALDKGQHKILYSQDAIGASLQPFLFERQTVNVAIADFAGDGRMGWAMWAIPDADYYFQVTEYDAKTGKWLSSNVPADDVDAKVEVIGGKVLVPFCDSRKDATGKLVFDLYFDVYRVHNGELVKAGPRIVARSAPPSEREQCRATKS